MKKISKSKLTVFLLALTAFISLNALPATAAQEDAPAAVIAMPETRAAETLATETPIKETRAVAPAKLASADFKAEIIRLINAERNKAGVARLVLMDELSVIGDVRAQESAVVFKHTRPDGNRYITIFPEYSLGYRVAGENLAYGYKTPEAFVKAWMNSGSHKANILDPDFHYIGIGCFVSDSGKIYCSTMFYTPKSV